MRLLNFFLHDLPLEHIARKGSKENPPFISRYVVLKNLKTQFQGIKVYGKVS